jgi:CBS domain containing-hemolysin-like protein
VSTILIVAGATLLASFLCSLFEAALYSISLSGIEVLEGRGVRGARRLARLREDVEEPIAAILTVNTVAHTVGAAWCGALVGERFGSPAVGVFAAIFTVLVLALTEIVPKSLGVRYATQLGPRIVAPIQIMIWSTWPVVWAVKRMMARLKGANSSQGPSEDEVAVLARMAARHGAVSSDEHRWVENALALDRVTAGELRTPRTVVETLDAGTPLKELAEHVERWIHSRVPVTEDDDPDRVIGLVHRREVLDTALRRPDDELVVRDLLRPIRFVPESMPANELLRHFIEDRAHMVAVVDEYGGIDGVVTLEDVLESMLGADIVDEHDEVESMQALALERRKRRATPGSDGERTAED